MNGKSVFFDLFSKGYPLLAGSIAILSGLA